MHKSAKKAIVIGASSGIGRAVAIELGKQGYDVGLMARREHLLREAAGQIHTNTFIQTIDISQPETAAKCLEQMIEKMGGVDVVIINSGVRHPNKQLLLKPELDTIAVNVQGFVAMATVAMNHFRSKNSGNLVGISSIAGLRGTSNAPSYNSSKAFVSIFLNGLWQKCLSTGITVTDIRPGFVETDMIANIKSKFWVATPEKAAVQILQAMDRKKKVAYVTRRYLLAAWLMRIIPDWLYYNVYKKLRVD